MDAKMPPKVTVRPMKHDEIDEVYALVEPEKWILCREKLELLLKYMPLVTQVLVSEKEEIAGTFAVTETYPGEFVLGNMVVSKTFRRQGLGGRIVREFSRTSPQKAMSLTAVPESLDFYSSIGFPQTDPPRCIIVSHITVDRQLVEDKLNAVKGELANVEIAPYDSSKLSDLIAYDNSARTYDNSLHTRVVAEFTSLLMAEDTSMNTVVGYAAPFLHDGEVVFDGIIADNDAVALCLFRASMKQFPDVAKAKLHSLQSQPLLTRMGMVTDTYPYLQCADGKPSPVPEARIYCASDVDYTAS